MSACYDGSGNWRVGSKNTDCVGSLPAGTRVDSYLLHRDPKTPNTWVYGGSVKFKQKILGIVNNYYQVGLTDPTLGHPGTLYGCIGGPMGQVVRTWDVSSWQVDAANIKDAGGKTFKHTSTRTANQIEELRILTEPDSLIACSYSMNHRARRLMADSHKILLIEYNIPVGRSCITYVAPYRSQQPLEAYARRAPHSGPRSGVAEV